MASVVSICNIALGWIGGNRIVSLNDGTIEAILCKDNYESLRDAVLEEANWTFASKRAALAPESVAPEFGYEYQFILPGSCLRVISVSDDPDPNNESEIEWVKEENKILVDNSVIYVKYIARIEDVSKFSSMFNQTLSSRISADLAKPISGSTSLQDKMWAVYNAKIEAAKNIDGLQGRNQKTKQGRLIRNR